MSGAGGRWIGGKAREAARPLSARGAQSARRASSAPASRPRPPPRRPRGARAREARRGVGPHDDARQGGRLGAGEFDLPGHVRPGLLRDRDDVDRQPALRYRPLRRGEHAGLAAAGGHADPLRAGVDQDGAGRPAHLRPDARAQVGDRDGRLLLLRRHVRELRRGAGGGQVHARRHPRARLPAPARGARLRVQQAPEDDLGQPGARLAAPLQRAGHRGVGAGRNGEGIEGGGRCLRGGAGAQDLTRVRAVAWVPPGAGLMPDAPGLELIAQELNEASDESVLGTYHEHGQACLIVNPQRILDVLRWLHGTPGQEYRFLSSLHGVDYLPAEPRFGVVYELLNMPRVERLRVRAAVADPGPDSLPELDSCVELFPTAEFQEREVYDFFGIVFRGHPDLRRILMPEDYVGWPQRRDFPVGGEPVAFTVHERDAAWYEHE